jgi:putative phosphoribosyl transferase
VICVRIPQSFSAVGEWYVDFAETSDDEVRDCLKESAADTGTVRVS